MAGIGYVDDLGVVALRDAEMEQDRRPDLHDALACPLPVLVIAHILGVPTDDIAQFKAWSDEQLRSGHAFVVPTTWEGETVLRYCVINPTTTVDDLRSVFDSLR